MQPLQRSYSLTKESIDNLIASKKLSSIYDEAKIAELETKEELTDKDKKTLIKLKSGEPLFNAIIEALNNAICSDVFMSPDAFEPILKKALAGVTNDRKLLEKIADGLSVMNKQAEIQRDKKGNIIYDKASKDTEIVKYDEDIEDYMKREVLPFVPDAKYFFEEDLSKKNPVIKTGAEIPFTRYFYKYKREKI